MTILNTETYPKIIRDFFRFDHSVSDGTAHKPVTLPFRYDTAELLTEAEQLPYKAKGPMDRCYVWGPEGKADPNGDLLTATDNKYSAQIDLTPYPAIRSFVESLNGIGPITYLTFKRMRPKSYVMPHIDSDGNPFEIYVPLSWPAGSVFKMLGHGNIDFGDLRPSLINVSDHMHSVVNDSDEFRTVLIFYADWSHPGWSTFLF